jgi:hypothetical protein
VSVEFTETAEQYKALTTSLQLQHEAHQKAAQIIATQQALLMSRQAQLDAANTVVADMKQQLLAAELRAGDLQQQLAAQREKPATLRGELAAARTQQSS